MSVETKVDGHVKELEGKIHIYDAFLLPFGRQAYGECVIGVC